MSEPEMVLDLLAHRLHDEELSRKYADQEQERKETDESVTRSDAAAFDAALAMMSEGASMFDVLLAARTAEGVGRDAPEEEHYDDDEREELLRSLLTQGDV